MSEAQSDSQQNTGAPNPILAQLRADVKELRGQLLALEKYVRNTSLTGRIRRIGAFVLGARLHELQHYRPRPLRIPDHYHTPLPIDHAPVISICTPSYNQGRGIERRIGGRDGEVPRPACSH
jgi:hypothetical protein